MTKCKRKRDPNKYDDIVERALGQCGNGIIKLHHNRIGDEGAYALAGALERSPNLDRLKELHLWNNSITSRGATALARVLAKSPHLTSLEVINLGWNWIGNEGIDALADALDHSPHLGKLEIIYLWGNRVSNEMRKRVNGAWQRGEDRRQYMAALFGAVEASSELRNIPALDYNAFTLVAPYL